ncbi:MAG: DUF3843 family protein [Cyclobacteriaceae bacterium]
MKRRIYIKDWLSLKPYQQQTATDLYYLKIANSIKDLLFSNKGFIFSFLIDSEEDINKFSCFLASYFEDVISATNIWGAFIAMHQKEYGRKLPFYKTDTYDEGEINHQDVSCLIWYFLNKVQSRKFASPYNDLIGNLATKVMELLEGEYEYAPENEVLKKIYSLAPNESDYYTVRNLIDTLLFDTYLFYPDTATDLKVLEKEIFEKDNKENLLALLQDSRDVFLHKTRTCMLGLAGKDWVAAILGEDHAQSNHIKALSPRIAGYFLYKGQDNQDVFLEHIASGKSFKLTKKSFDYASELGEIDLILYMGMVRWKNEWWFSGVKFDTPYNEGLVLEERNSVQSRRQVNFLDDQEKEKIEILNIQKEVFLSFNNDSPIAFLPVKDFRDFSNAFIDRYNKYLKDKSKQTDASEQREGEEFSKQEEKIDDNFDNVDEPGLVFFNPKGGLEMAWGVTSAFPLPHNPYYDQKESDENTLYLLVSRDISTELAMYCIEQCGSKLTFFTEKPGKDYLEDIDFLLRFWKKEEYYTQAAVTLV